MKNLLVLAVLLAGAAAYTWLSQNSVPRDVSAVRDKDFQVAPDFTAETMDGDSLSLSGHKGKTIVLNFWATWCAPCIVEFPMMLQLASATKNEAVFLFVSVDKDKEAITRFVDKYAPSLPQDNVHIIWNPEKDIAENLYGTFQLPETYLIDGNGMIREKIIGADIDWTSAGMQQKIKRYGHDTP